MNNVMLISTSTGQMVENLDCTVVQKGWKN